MAFFRGLTWRVIRRAAGVALLLLVALPPLWVELRPWRPSAGSLSLPPLPETAQYRVYVADWGYHTSIILEQPAGWRLGPPGEETTPFVEFAWGDRRFYKDSDYWPHSLLITLLLPSAAVTYVDGWRQAPVLGAGMRQLLVRDVSAAELHALAREVAAWRSEPEPYPVVRGYRGRFYRAPGEYLWWTNCNRWTVDRLARVGLARGGRGVIFSGQVAARLTGFRSAALGAT